MKLTFQAQYYWPGSNPVISPNSVDVTIYKAIDERLGTVLIEDKPIKKRMLAVFNPHNMTVHSKFAIRGDWTIVTAEEMRKISSQTYIQIIEDKEFLCGIHSSGLIVESGTFDKILKMFSLIPDETELLLF